MFSEKENSHQAIDNAELQGIMEELEDLEKELSSEDQEANSLEASGDSESLQKNFQANSEAPQEDGRESLRDILMREAEKAEMAEGQKEQQGPSQKHASGVTFRPEVDSESKNLDFEMSFPIGHKRVKFTVRPGERMLIALDGVDLTIDEENCSISLKAGVNFAIPHGEKKSRPKAA